MYSLDIDLTLKRIIMNYKYNSTDIYFLGVMVFRSVAFILNTI